MAENKAEKKAKGAAYGVRLVDAGGSELRFKANTGKTGQITSFVFYRLPKGANGKRPAGKRGATQTHTSFDAAKAAVDAAVAVAAKQGWTRPARAATSRTDSFDLKSIPAPKLK